MKRIGKILLGVTVVAGLIGGGIWYSKQRAAQNPEQSYKVLSVERCGETQPASLAGAA